MKGGNLTDEELARYSRQMLFSPLGREGQKRLKQAKVAVVGCGALGCGVITGLARAGIGALTLVDRDFVEWSDLQRQLLYEEHDAEQSLPKAMVAADRIGRINSHVKVQGIVEHVNHHNAVKLLSGHDLIVDGSDNFEVRFLINDLCVKESTPWIYGGCVGSLGTSMAVIPGVTACLRCIYPEPPPPEDIKTCDTTGVIQPAAAMVSAWQTAQALRFLSGNTEASPGVQITFDIWKGEVRFYRLERDPACPCCSKKTFEFLEGGRMSRTASLCGRTGVQILPDNPKSIDLKSLASRIGASGKVTANRFLLKLDMGECRITLFRNGRIIVTGTTDPKRARALCARYLGF